MKKTATLASLWMCVRQLFFAMALGGLFLSASGARSDEAASVAVAPSLPDFPVLPELKSYDELVSASPAARIHYLDQLRLMLVDLSTMEAGDPSSFIVQESMQNHYRQWAALLGLLGAEEAKAAKKSKAKSTAWADPGNCDYTKDNNCRPRPADSEAGAQTLMPNAATGAAGKGPKWKDAGALENDWRQKDDAENPEKPDICKDPHGKWNWKENEKQREQCSKAKGEMKEGEPCFFAGNALKYESRGGRVSCPAPHKICEKTLQAPEKGGKCDGPELKCDNPKDVVCSPLLFGRQEDGKPFCVPTGGGKSKTATKACYAHAYAYENEAATGSEKKARERNDNLVENDSEKTRGAYNKIKESMDKLCPKDVSQMTHGNCTACSAARLRVRAMNAYFDSHRGDKTLKKMAANVNCDAGATGASGAAAPLPPARPADLNSGSGAIK